jgi:hypothetical protein
MDGQRSRDGNTRVTVESGEWDNRYHELYVSAATTTHNALTDTFRLVIQGADIQAGGHYDAWMLGQDDAQFQGGDDTDTLSIPADAQNVISVGDYATKISWSDAGDRMHSVCEGYPCKGGRLSVGDIAASSSHGPTADGRQKPDLAAPGTVITSTLSHDAPVCRSATQDNCVDPTFITPDGRNLTYSGTSMSAPHVAGTVALMLQVNPTLDQNSVAQILRSTARHDQFTGSAAWSPDFGAGKLDALAAVERVLGASVTPPTTTPEVTPTAPVPITFTLQRLRVEGSAGKPVKQIKAGKPVNLAVYIRFSSLPDDTPISVEWTITQGAGVVGYDSQQRVLGHADTGTSRWVWRFSPRRSGKYTVAARVTAGGSAKESKLTLKVLPKG